MSTPYLRFTGGALRIRAPAKTTMTYGVDTSILKTNTPVAVVEVPVVVEVPTVAPEPVVEVPEPVVVEVPTVAPEPVVEVEVATAAPEPELNRDYTPLEVKPTLEIPEASLESGLVPENPAA